ncbi:Ferritin heavy chain B [Fasciola hepatica]|uniref:Ferritin n=1 Tax=Fasciola hepatica TaxID=6192 RepID=A0A2H1CBB5_FASHE|nr:Ferritin heavy chain B [Fasciola hepatica]
MASPSRQNFAEECEAAINRQINVELEASYAYLAFATYFGQDTVALPHAEKFFLKQSHEEREHAEKLAKYQNLRGGRVVYQDIHKPTKTVFASLRDAMETALAMEKAVNESLLQLHALASQHNDPALQDYLEGEFLKEQLESISQFAHYITQTKRAGTGLGEYLFDKLTLKD